MICPLTGLESKVESNEGNIFKVSYSNEAVGKVSMARILYDELERGKYNDVKYIIAGISIQQFKKTNSEFEINHGLIEEGYKKYNYPKEFDEKANYMLNYFYENGGKEYKSFEIRPEINYTLTFAFDSDEFERILLKLKDEGYIRLNNVIENEAGEMMIIELNLTKEGINNVKDSQSKTSIRNESKTENFNNLNLNTNKSSKQSDNVKGKSNFKYDVALSFAGEQRDYVDEVARCLEQKGITYFYDYDNGPTRLTNEQRQNFY